MERRSVNCAFYKNKLHSRVITTTRNVSVSEECLSSADDMIHKMKPLSDEDSQILFHRRIFQSEEKCPEDLQVVSRNILKKCGGVPLAFIAIASLLASNQRVKQKYEWMHLHNSIGRGVTQGDIVKDMKRILSLSYYDLPSHLKPCLLYLSIFPEDFYIEREFLIWRWLAEGFIRCDKEESRLFEIGESYFNELINRSLIQPEIDQEGMVVACRIHDMVLDLIRSLSCEENLISILDNAEWHAPNLQGKFRRLSLHNIKAKFHNHQFDSTILPKVRTFSVFSPVICDWLPSLSSFQFLRVLDLGNCDSCKSNSGIRIKYVGNLIHLRYLGLRNVDVDELPMDIGKLQFLQTLDIFGTNIDELPSSVVQLRNLICLHVDCRMKVPKGMENLTSLEVLAIVNLAISPHIVKELSNLMEVTTLQLSCYGIDEDLMNMNILIESLGNLHKLQNLDILFGSKLIDRMGESWVPPPHLRSLKFVGFSDAFLRLPKWVNSTALPHLSNLTINVEELQGEDIQIIGTLPALRFLQLSADRVMGTLVVSADAFPSARCCIFRGFLTSMCLFPPGAMPRVQRLVFTVSARSIASGEVDCGMGHLPSLEYVMVLRQRDNSSDEETETAKAWLRCAAKAHPKCPTIEIY